jgi:hypothetical protein
MRRVDAALDVDRDADQLDGQAMKLRQVRSRKAEHAGDHLEREREVSARAPGRARPRSRSASMQRATIGRTSVALPALHRLLAEDLLEEVSVAKVLGLVHLEDEWPMTRPIVLP